MSVKNSASVLRSVESLWKSQNRPKSLNDWAGKIWFPFLPLVGSAGTCPDLRQVQEGHWKVPQCPQWTMASTSAETWGIQRCFEACVWQVWAHITPFYTLLICHDLHPRDTGRPRSPHLSAGLPVGGWQTQTSLRRTSGFSFSLCPPEHMAWGQCRIQENPSRPVRRQWCDFWATL